MHQLDNRREQIYDFVFHIGQVFLYLFFTNLLLSTVFFVLGFTVTPLLFPLSLIAAVVLLAAFYGQKLELPQFLCEIVVALLLIIFCAVVAGWLYDFSYDGNAYHKLAEGMLANGWNPLFQVPDGAYIQTMIGCADTEMSQWLECYPKATEIFAASIYAITDNVESGKIYTVLGMIAAFCVTAKLLQNQRGGILFATAAALSPVAVAQMDTFYLDGLLHIHVYLLAALLFAEHTDMPPLSRKTAWSLILAVMTVLANIKFTGLFYGAFFCVSYYLYEITIKRKQLSPDRQKNYILRRTGLYALTAICSVIWGGAAAYVTNVLRYGNPVYTLIGEGARDIFSANSPFPGTNGIINLVLSLFSKVGSVFNGAYSVGMLKLPFTMDWQAERVFLAYPDIRLSGFGVLFGGLFLVSAIILLIHFSDSVFRKNHPLIFLNVVICLALMVIIEHSWWARYAPYCYIFFLLGLYVLMRTQKKRLFVALVVLSICNSLCWFPDIRAQYGSSAAVREQFSQWGNSQTEIRFDYTLNGGYYPGMCYNLKDFEIPYTVDPNLDQIEGTLTVYSGMALYSMD